MMVFPYNSIHCSKFFTNGLLFTNIEPNPKCVINENKLGSEQGVQQSSNKKVHPQEDIVGLLIYIWEFSNAVAPGP